MVSNANWPVIGEGPSFRIIVLDLSRPNGPTEMKDEVIACAPIRRVHRLRRLVMHQGRFFDRRCRHVALIEQHSKFCAAENQTTRVMIDKAFGDAI